jgi:hypothetical protein
LPDNVDIGFSSIYLVNNGKVDVVSDAISFYIIDLLVKVILGSTIKYEETINPIVNKIKMSIALIIFS